jgi:uncharacterized ubiquitin-like protein YukD
MAYVAVTLEYGRDTIDLALPMNVPSHLLVDGLVPILKLSNPRGNSYFLGVKSEQGLRRISANANLGDIGLLHGTVVVLAENEREEKLLLETEAYLKAENGSIFPLKTKTTLIGRTDAKSGIFVDIDLSSLAADPKAISRRHAQIEQEGRQFYLVDLVSVNGTKINGQRIPPNKKSPIRNGDVIEFGRATAQMIFHTGKNKKV